MTGGYFPIEKENGNQWEALDVKDDVALGLKTNFLRVDSNGRSHVSRCCNVRI